MQLFLASLFLACSASSVLGSRDGLKSLEKGRERKLGLRNGYVNVNSTKEGQKGGQKGKGGQGRDSKKEDGGGTPGRKSDKKGDNGRDDRGAQQATGQFPPEGNEFKAPAQGDIRSPCPAINTIANHGFINRDGTSILVGDLAQALEDIYRVSAETLTNGPIASAIRLGLTEEVEGNDFLTIDRLFQNRDSKPDFEAQEHDSSFFREDSDLGNDRLPSSRLIEDFFDMRGRIEPKDVMAFQRGRIQESCVRHETDDPTTTRMYTGGHRGGMAIQGALLFILGQSLKDVDRSSVRSIVELETLPDNYDPNDEILFTFDDSSEENALRDKFRANVDKAICEYCPTDDAFPCNIVAIE